MDVLIIGAGAVGQSYGLVLSRCGARVSYYVRPRRREEALRGYVVHELSWRGRVHSAEVKPDSVVTSPAEASARRWDQVWITVPADVLEQPWLRELIEQSGDATVVMLQPGLRNRELVAAWCGEERLVVGIITFIAWHAPLPGEALPHGVALYVPPFAPVPFSGVRAREVALAFARGGARARAVRDAAEQAAFGSAVLQTFVVALESAGWSLDALLSGERVRQAAHAAREALAIASAVVEVRPPPFALVLRPFPLRLGVSLARRVTPFDLEVYLREHFTKVGAQTALALDELLDAAAERSLPVPHLAALAERFRAVRSGEAPRALAPSSRP